MNELLIDRVDGCFEKKKKKKTMDFIQFSLLYLNIHISETVLSMTFMTFISSFMYVYIISFINIIGYTPGRQLWLY